MRVQQRVQQVRRQGDGHHETHARVEIHRAHTLRLLHVPCRVPAGRHPAGGLHPPDRRLEKCRLAGVCTVRNARPAFVARLMHAAWHLPDVWCDEASAQRKGAVGPQHAFDKAPPFETALRASNKLPPPAGSRCHRWDRLPAGRLHWPNPPGAAPGTVSQGERKRLCAIGVSPLVLRSPLNLSKGASRSMSGLRNGRAADAALEALRPPV